MRVHYDSDVDILSIVLVDARAARSKEVRPGVVADLDQRGRVLGFEVQGVRQLYPDLDLGNYAPITATPQWLPLKEAAKRAGILADTLRQQVLAGKAKAEKIGRQWLIREDWLHEYLKIHRRQEASDGASATKTSKNLSLKEASARLGIHPNTLRRYILAGKVQGQKIGRYWHLHEDEVKRISAPLARAALTGAVMSLGAVLAKRAGPIAGPIAEGALEEAGRAIKAMK